MSLVFFANDQEVEKVNRTWFGNSFIVQRAVMMALESTYNKSLVSKWTVSSYRPHLIYIHWAYKIFQLAERLQEIIREMFLFWWPSESSPSVSIKHFWAQEKPPAIKPLHLQYPFKQRALCVRSWCSDGGKNQPCSLNLHTQVTLMLTSSVWYGRNKNLYENWIENVSV